MVSAHDGTTLWTLPLKNFMSTMTLKCFGDHVLIFHGDEHLWVNATNGKIDHRVAIVGDVMVNLLDRQTGKRSTKQTDLKSANKSRMLIQQSNLLVGKYHYFRSYTRPWLGRVDVVSGEVAYLELPLQIKRTSEDSHDHFFWESDPMPDRAIALAKNSQRKPLKKLPLQFTGFALNDMKNASGFSVVGDARSKGNGWAHHASQVPTAIGEHLYVPNMSGTVYVIRHSAKKLNSEAIVAINDLGPIGGSFNRASLSFANGRLFAHTIKEIICIE